MNWVATEMQGIEMGDERLNDRAMYLLDSLTSQPNMSIPTACRSWVETQAAYRFFDNVKVTAEKVLSSHQQASCARLKDHEVVLCIEDTTELEYKDQAQVRGLGPLTYAEQRGLHLHPTLAVTPQRLCLGILNQLMWTRSEDSYGKRVDRAHKSIEEKESFRWLQGYRQVCALSRENKQTRLVYIADREGDIYDLFVEGELQQHPADYLIRAYHDRILMEDGKISDALARAPCLGKVAFHLPHSHKRPQKHVEQVLKATRVTLRQPWLCDTPVDQVEITVLLAQETHPPKGQEAMTWILITNRRIETQEQAIEALNWYLCRWQIEVYFRILKSGCKIEKLQLETMERLQPAIALYMIIAWRVLYLTMLGRDCPNLPCDVVFETEEWQSVYIVTHNKPPPIKPPPLNTMMRMIANYGGFLGRKHDGEPGPQSVWIGLQRTRDFVLAIEATKKIQSHTYA